MNFFDTTPNFNVPAEAVHRPATVILLNEKVQVIMGSQELIFGEEFMHVLRNGRIAKMKKDCLVFEDAE